MRVLYILAPIAALLIGAPGGNAAEEPVQPRTVVELFTSQGCSSCPPADAFLGELAKRPDVIALGFHVDYWDYIGWKDPFASPDFTNRQRAYAQALGRRYVYTPQMVVDGMSHATGSRVGEVERLIAQRHGSQRLPVRLVRGGPDRLKVSVGSAAGAGPADVWFVTYTRARTTDVARGENSGRRLTDYNIVRRITHLGRWAGAAADFTATLGEEEADGCAVLVQAEGHGEILGSAIEILDR
ncbi:MAG: DUF1223 domain-containing protein [Kiloniellales bacterium]